MSTVNVSTSFTPFQLYLGRAPHLVPALYDNTTDAVVEDSGIAAEAGADLVKRIQVNEMKAQDNLLLAKMNQALQANKHRGPEHEYRVGEKVLLSTFHRRREYMQRGDNRVAKFMVRYDGPYTITHAVPQTSTYTLDLPKRMKISQLSTARYSSRGARTTLPYSLHGNIRAVSVAVG